LGPAQQSRRPGRPARTTDLTACAMSHIGKTMGGFAGNRLRRRPHREPSPGFSLETGASCLAPHHVGFDVRDAGNCRIGRGIPEPKQAARGFIRHLRCLQAEETPVTPRRPAGPRCHSLAGLNGIGISGMLSGSDLPFGSSCPSAQSCIWSGFGASQGSEKARGLSSPIVGS
jgi:hypothetical protein